MGCTGSKQKGVARRPEGDEGPKISDDYPVFILNVKRVSNVKAYDVEDWGEVESDGPVRDGSPKTDDDDVNAASKLPGSAEGGSGEGAVGEEGSEEWDPQNPSPSHASGGARKATEADTVGASSPAGPAPAGGGDDAAQNAAQATAGADSSPAAGDADDDGGE